MLLGRWGYWGSALVARTCVQDMRACPSRVHCLEGRESQDAFLPRQGKAVDQVRPKAAPAAAKRGVQLHLVGNESPSPSVTRSLWLLHGDKMSLELEPMALLSLSLLENRVRGWQPHPGLRAAPALWDAGSVSLWMHMLLHSHKCISACTWPVQPALAQLVQNRPSPCNLAFVC